MEPLPCLRQIELIRLSRDIPHASYSELSVTLGFSFEHSQSILSTHLKEYNEAIVDILIKWNDKQADSSDHDRSWPGSFMMWSLVDWGQNCPKVNSNLNVTD